MLAEDLDGLNKMLEVKNFYFLLNAFRLNQSCFTFQTVSDENPELIDDFLNTYFMEKSHKTNECCFDAIIELYVGVLKISLVTIFVALQSFLDHKFEDLGDLFWNRFVSYTPVGVKFMIFQINLCSLSNT